MPITPISPKDIAKTKIKIMPDLVIACWNNAIAKHYSNGSAVIKQDDIVKDIMAELVVDRSDVFSNKWLDIEPVFEAVGWDVEYDKPSYCENYPTTFTFTPKS